MDKAPDYGSGDSRFESWQDRENLTIFFSASNATNSPGKIALIRLIIQKNILGKITNATFTCTRSQVIICVGLVRVFHRELL